MAGCLSQTERRKGSARYQTRGSFLISSLTVWKRYNESYLALRGLASTPDEEITEAAAPMLYRAGSPAVSHTTITRITDPNDASVELGLLISVDVEWGAANSRRRLSATHTAKVFKGGTEDS